MSSNEKKDKGIMLVEDPKETLQTLCYFREGVVDLYKFKFKYEEIIGRSSKPIHIKNAHTHFYSLTLFGLLIPSESKGIYKLSNEADKICHCLEEKNIEEYQKILQYILINNKKKGELFKKFLVFLKKKPYRTRNEIYNEFKTIPGKSLIAWSLEANFINYHKDNVWIVNLPEKKMLNIDEFWNLLLKLYNEMSSTNILGIKQVYVDIRDLAFEFCIKNTSWTIEDFDKMLRQLLDSDRGDLIRLYGAPTSYFDRKKNFIYQNREYAFIRIMVA